VTNFSFLDSVFPDLSRLGELAERNLFDDPQTTVTKLRLMCENIAADLCQIESVRVNSDKQIDRLQKLSEEGIIPNRVKDHFHNIRQSGNRAT